jgi:hypothetical protein
MLTQPDGTREGKFKKYDVGTRRSGLHSFLQSRAASGDLEVRAMREYFASRRVEYRPIGDTPEKFYSHATREQYFCAIPDSSLRQAVVFFDPDIGLNVGSDSYMKRVGIDK